MSYIYCSDDNHYKFIGSLQNFFEDLVVQPFERNLPELVEDFRQVRIQNLKYQREIILEQGRTDFDKPFEGPQGFSLSPEDKVSLYCGHYMPMHLFSSYHIFTNYLTPVSNKVIFIDFGCGPLTSGIAFWAFARQSDVIYLGIDSSQAMLNKAREINEYGPNRWYPFFRKFETIRNYSQLSQLLNNYIKTDDNPQIIFNFCYFLASRTLDLENLSNVLISIVKEYSQHKMFIIYQNPDPQSLSESLRLELYGNWDILQTNLLKVRTPRFRSNIPASQHIQSFKYDRPINNTLHRDAKVYSDILAN